MYLFEGNVQLVGLESEVVDDTYLQIDLALGMGLPTAQGVMVMPVALLHGALSKKAAIEFFESALEKAKAMPEDKPKSDLIIPSSLQDVEQVAQIDQKLKGKG